MNTKSAIKCWFILSFQLLVHLSIAQTPPKLDISPNPEDFAICPDAETSYTLTNYNALCHDLSVTNGTITEAINSNNVFKVKWSDTGQKGKIQVTRKTEGCSNSAPSKSWDVPILTLVNTTPTITIVPATFPVGINNAGTATATLNYPYAGTGDITPITVNSFTWTISPTPAWQFTPPTTNYNPTFTTDLSSTGTITAVGINGRCAATTKPSSKATKTIPRYMPNPCPITGAPPYVLCTDQTPFTVVATVPTGTFNPPIVYNWTAPSGWNSNGQLNNAYGLVPNGISGGTVSVTATSYGLTSSACSQLIPFHVLNPATKVLGPALLCYTPQSYKLDIQPLAGIDVNWKVVNQNDPNGPVPVSPTSGTGIEAILSATGNGGGAPLRIIFTAGTAACGSETRSLDFFAGTPSLLYPRIDGDTVNFAYVCPGSHWAAIDLTGGSSNCVTWTNYSPPPILTFPACLEFDVYIPYRSGPCAAFNASASNACGSNDVYFFICPKSWGCESAEPADENKGNFDLRVFPNPATDILNVELIVPEQIKETSVSTPEMQGIRLFDKNGNLKKENFETGALLHIRLDGLTDGQYTLQTIVHGKAITKQVVLWKE